MKHHFSDSLVSKDSEKIYFYKSPQKLNERTNLNIVDLIKSDHVQAHQHSWADKVIQNRENGQTRDVIASNLCKLTLPTIVSRNTTMDQ